MTIRAVIFDLGDTLFRLDPMPTNMRERLTRRMYSGTTEASRAAAARAAESAVRAAVEHAHAEGATTEIDLAVCISEAFARHEIEMDTWQGGILAREYGIADIERFRPGPDCADRVAAFRDRGLKIGLVSNTTTRPARMERYLDSIGLLGQLDHRVYSCALGIRKPHPDIYRAALDGLSVQADDAVFVGDRLREDVAGPQSIGMRAVLTHEFRADPPDGKTEPLAVIRSLPELHAVLDRLI
ncbi:hypothetical protein AYO38_06010 [bacterium SCGC AG-212-C10]|nr:hypothetical protein AYO38_06010 [bacterium SCGC AG-212-C10]